LLFFHSIFHEHVENFGARNAHSRRKAAQPWAAL